MTGQTAADAEAMSLELWIHAWVGRDEARWWRQLLAERFADEMAEAVARRARGDRSDVWGEVRRLADWCGVIDDTLAYRGDRLPSWQE